MHKLHGSHFILAKLPIWATTAIFAGILMTVLVGRDIFEGLMYNIAYSSMVGDAALLIVVLIGATVLQRGGLPQPQWLRGRNMHLAVLYASVVLGAIVSHFTLSSRSGQQMDVYHDLVIAPLFLYLAVTILPVVYYNGFRRERVTTLCLVLFWAGLVVLDIAQDRMNQRRWIHNHINVIEQMK